VTAATLTVTADPQTKAYGAANPPLNGALWRVRQRGHGGEPGDAANRLDHGHDGECGRTYPIAASGAVSANANYTFSYVDGALTVTPAVLRVTADDQTKAYGAANPPLTVHFSGFVNGETTASLTTPPTVSTTATTASAVGTYPVTRAARSPGAITRSAT